MRAADARRLLEERATLHRAHKDAFYRLSDTRRAQLAEAMRAARDRLFDDLFGEQEAVRSPGVPLAVRAYAARTDWAFLDLVALAACTELPAEDVGDQVAPRALVYQALRMLDDVLDDHRDYKGGALTLLGELRLEPALSHLAIAANLLPMTMMIVRAGGDLDQEDRRLAQETLRGMLAESTADDWTPARYREMALAKMVSYGQFLYRPVVACFPDRVRLELEPFLARSFYVAQLLNDLHDRDDDLRRGQPNYWTIGEHEVGTDTSFFRELEYLATLCEQLDAVVQPYAHARVADLIGYLLQIDRGTFAD